MSIGSAPELTIRTTSSHPCSSSCMKAFWFTKKWNDASSGTRSRAIRGWVCCTRSCEERASARLDGKRSTSSMQLYMVKGHGRTVDILQADPLAAPSEFLLVICISHTVSASIRSMPLMDCLRLLSSRRFSSSQKLNVFPVTISNEISSHLGPFSMLLDTFSNEYIFITAPWSSGPLVRSESFLVPTLF